MLCGLISQPSASFSLKTDCVAGMPQATRFDREFVSAPALGSMRRVAVIKHKDDDAATTE
jgi:hypothetical protein